MLRTLLSKSANFGQAFVQNTVFYKGSDAHIEPQLKECRYKMETHPIGNKILIERPTFTNLNSYGPNTVGSIIAKKNLTFKKETEIYAYIRNRVDEVEQYLIAGCPKYNDLILLLLYEQLGLPTMFLRLARDQNYSWQGMMSLEARIHKCRKINMSCEYALNVDMDLNAKPETVFNQFKIDFSIE